MNGQTACFGDLYFFSLSLYLSLIHSFTQLLTHSLTHSIIHSPTHSFTNSLIHSPKHSFTISLTSSLFVNISPNANRMNLRFDKLHANEHLCLSFCFIHFFVLFFLSFNHLRWQVILKQKQKISKLKPTFFPSRIHQQRSFNSSTTQVLEIHSR